MLCTSLGDFLFRLYLYRLNPRCGHIWYAVHDIKSHDYKRREEILSKVARQYGVVTPSNRNYRRKKGLAIVEVMVWQEMLLLTATAGHHDTFFADQRRTGLYDFRKKALMVGGYAVGITDGHPSVMIERSRWERIERQFLEQYWHHDDCARRFNEITPFSFWHIVNWQLQPLAVELTKKRKTAGLSPVELVVAKKSRTHYHSERLGGME